MESNEVDKSVQESLAFNDELEAKENGIAPHPLGVVLALYIAVSYGVLSYGVDIPAWALVVYLIVLFGGLIAYLLLRSRDNVRASYRQDPHAEPDKSRWAIPVIIMVPVFFRPLAEGNLFISILIGLFVLGGLGWIWKKNPEWL